MEGRAVASSWFGAGSSRIVVERDHVEEQDLEGTIKLKCIFKTLNGRAWTGLIWLKLRTGGWLL